MTDAIGIGDVCLDLTQGRPVHVIEATGQTVAEWSDANGYDLLDNYGNGRVDTDPDDLVFDVVYCSNANSEPSKTYAMPSSRLLRIETEAADDDRPVAGRVMRDTLRRLFYQASGSMVDQPDPAVLAALARDAGFSDELIEEARELADIDRTVVVDD